MLSWTEPTGHGGGSPGEDEPGPGNGPWGDQAWSEEELEGYAWCVALRVAGAGASAHPQRADERILRSRIFGSEAAGFKTGESNTPRRGRDPVGTQPLPGGPSGGRPSRWSTCGPDGGTLFGAVRWETVWPLKRGQAAGGGSSEWKPASSAGAVRAASRRSARTGSCRDPEESDRGGRRDQDVRNALASRTRRDGWPGWTFEKGGSRRFDRRQPVRDGAEGASHPMPDRWEACVQSFDGTPRGSTSRVHMRAGTVLAERTPMGVARTSGCGSRESRVVTAGRQQDVVTRTGC